MYVRCTLFLFFFFKQKTAYEMRISDWSSDVCSSDLEPTAGVDIELRQQLWSYVRGLNQAGVTVVLTTHYLEEAEELCDRRSEERRGGQECVSTCRSRWSRYH